MSDLIRRLNRMELLQIEDGDTAVAELIAEAATAIATLRKEAGAKQVLVDELIALLEEWDWREWPNLATFAKNIAKIKEAHK